MTTFIIHRYSFFCTIGALQLQYDDVDDVDDDQMKERRKSISLLLKVGESLVVCIYTMHIYRVATESKKTQQLRSTLSLLTGLYKLTDVAKGLCLGSNNPNIQKTFLNV